MASTGGVVVVLADDILGGGCVTLSAVLSLIEQEVKEGRNWIVKIQPEDILRLKELKNASPLASAALAIIQQRKDRPIPKNQRRSNSSRNFFLRSQDRKSSPPLRRTRPRRASRSTSLRWYGQRSSFPSSIFTNIATSCCSRRTSPCKESPSCRRCGKPESFSDSIETMLSPRSPPTLHSYFACPWKGSRAFSLTRPGSGARSDP